MLWHCHVSRLATRLAQLNDRRVVLAIDGDDAGTLATERAACALAPEFTDVRAVKRRDYAAEIAVIERRDRASPPVDGASVPLRRSSSRG